MIGLTNKKIYGQSVRDVVNTADGELVQSRTVVLTNLTCCEMQLAMSQNGG